VLVRDEEDYSEAMRLGAFEAIPIACRRSDVQWTMIHALRKPQNPPQRSADQGLQEN
jgi:hypothetical protein